MRLLRGSYPYAEICQLTYNFLPIFQEHPEAWNAVRQMPVSNSKISDYMQEWYNAVDEQDKVYVEKLANTIDISINRSPINIVTNDNSVNLTFTHKDDFSLTPINTINEWDGWRAGVWEKHPDGNITNKPVQYRGFPESNIWSHWMYAHATSFVKYNITDLKAFKYASYFGLASRDCGGAASMQFVAHVDSVEIYRSKELYLADHGVYIEFAIPQGAKNLTIEIDDLGNNGCDHYVLGEPKLFYTDGQVAGGADINADVNKDGYIDLYDVMIVRSGMQNTTTYNTDINNDGITDEADLLIVKMAAMEAIIAASPGKRKIKLTTWGAIKQR